MAISDQIPRYRVGGMDLCNLIEKYTSQLKEVAEDLGHRNVELNITSFTVIGRIVVLTLLIDNFNHSGQSNDLPQTINLHSSRSRPLFLQILPEQDR